MDETFKLCMANLMSHMYLVQKEIEKIKIFEEGVTQEQKNRYRYLTIMLIALNDSAHVGYEQWLEEFPSDKEAVDYFRGIQKRSIAGKLIGECKCKSCEGEKDEMD